MAKQLNAFAPEFVPRWKQPATSHCFYGYSGSYCNADSAFEEAVTSEELEELEACEEWVRTMAELDELEREHLIATALAEAEPSQILEVEMRAFARESSSSARRRKAEAKRKGKQ